MAKKCGACDFQVVLVGDLAVGKSALLQRLRGEQDRQYVTIAVDFCVHTIEVDGKAVKMLIWDPTGNRRYSGVTAAYYRHITGAIVVYDITNSASFEGAEWWADHVDAHAPGDVPKLLLGTKSDLATNRAVPRGEAQAFADGRGMPFLEASAKERTNVEEAFRTIVRAMEARRARQPTGSSEGPAVVAPVNSEMVAHAHGEGQSVSTNDTPGSWLPASWWLALLAGQHPAAAADEAERKGLRACDDNDAPRCLPTNLDILRLVVSCGYWKFWNK